MRTPENKSPAAVNAPLGAYHDDGPFQPGDEGPAANYHYSSYGFVGRMRILPEDFDTNVARARAAAKFGASVKIFRTAEYWVVHRGS